MSLRRLVILSTFPLSVLSASAQAALALEDPASGLKVELSDDFIAEVSPGSAPGYDVLIGVDSVSGKPPIVGASDHLCAVAYTAAPQNAGLTQAEINATLDTPDWGQQARKALAATLTVDAMEAFQLGGATGAEFIATPKLGPDHDNVRLVLSMIETPKGRTVVTCAATADTLRNALPVFRTIRSGVTPP